MNLLIEMFQYPFLQRAAIVGLIVAVCAALLGTSLVMKRYSMIGDGLSHVGFTALAIAYAFQAAPLYFAIPICMLAAFFLLRLQDNSKIKGDAATALLCSGSLAIGVLVISLTTGMNTDVCNYMFGSILAMSKTDVYISIGLGIFVIVLYVLYYERIFAITFDETFASATGVQTKSIQFIIAMLTSLTVVLGMRMMGTLLISSLIVFPCLSAMRITKSYKDTILYSAIISIICFLIGLIVSYYYAIPTGACIVIMNLLVFIVLWGIEKYKG